MSPSAASGSVRVRIASQTTAWIWGRASLVVQPAPLDERLAGGERRADDAEVDRVLGPAV